MTSHDFIIPGDLARSARALTQVSYAMVAEAADLSAQRLRAYEQGDGTLDAEENLRLRRALEEFGALFVAEDERAGYGVRKKWSESTTQRVETWEGEGGLAGDDDI
ncbi:hypothetical protein [Granulicoccus phenolivorans]|uniref:hypothetical protein n=1 Tax=Granulicoccus phenolivorans TaxID=266854 RepID=UPI0003F998E2|nr:hypothetical protein [Granulicoccus phenolivorans]